MKRKIGIRDVAKAANVGTGTVSRVLNNHPAVSLEARARILSVMAELGYEPDSIAKSMRSSSSKTLGIVIPAITNPFFAELVEALEIEARKRDFHVYLMISHEDDAIELECIASLTRRKVDGIVLVPHMHGPKSLGDLKTPVVVVDRVPEGVPGVSSDHFEGARMAVEYLRSLGHEYIGCIAGPPDALPAQERLEGYLAIMEPRLKALGYSRDDYMSAGPFTVESGSAGFRRLIEQRDKFPVTAIFACSDQQAIGALRAASDLGLKVPEELSIMGYDGIPLSDLVKPRLSTVAQPVPEIAEAAVNRILSSDNSLWRERDRLPCRLVVRESCAPPQAPHVS